MNELPEWVYWCLLARHALCLALVAHADAEPDHVIEVEETT